MKKEKTKPCEWQGLTSKSEGRQFLVLAAVILPIVMVMGIAAYGFFVWLLQIFFLGPPS